MAKPTTTPESSRQRRAKRSKEAQEALEWVKERARPRDTKHTALPEAEGAAIGEPSRPARLARRPTRRKTV